VFAHPLMRTLSRCARHASRQRGALFAENLRELNSQFSSCAPAALPFCLTQLLTAAVCDTAQLGAESAD
jgi:hypothetical protein